MVGRNQRPAVHQSSWLDTPPQVGFGLGLQVISAYTSATSRLSASDPRRALGPLPFNIPGLLIDSYNVRTSFLWEILVFFSQTWEVAEAPLVLQILGSLAVDFCWSICLLSLTPSLQATVTTVISQPHPVERKSPRIRKSAMTFCPGTFIVPDSVEGRFLQWTSFPVLWPCIGIPHSLRTSGSPVIVSFAVFVCFVPFLHLSL